MLITWNQTLNSNSLEAHGADQMSSNTFSPHLPGWQLWCITGASALLWECSGPSWLHNGCKPYWPRPSTAMPSWCGTAGISLQATGLVARPAMQIYRYQIIKSINTEINQIIKSTILILNIMKSMNNTPNITQSLAASGGPGSTCTESMSKYIKKQHSQTQAQCK